MIFLRQMKKWRERKKQTLCSPNNQRMNVVFFLYYLAFVQIVIAHVFVGCAPSGCTRVPRARPKDYTEEEEKNTRKKASHNSSNVKNYLARSAHTYNSFKLSPLFLSSVEATRISSLCLLSRARLICCLIFFFRILCSLLVSTVCTFEYE